MAASVIWGDSERGIFDPVNVAEGIRRATRYLRYVRPPPNFYDGLIDFYKVKTDHLRPGHPEGDMPRSFPHLKNDTQFGMWGDLWIDKVYPNKTIDNVFKHW